MNDDPNDQLVDDNALFAELTGPAPAAEVETPIPAASAETPAAEAAPAAAAPGTPEPAIPPGRLREEADARRQAERERDDLRAELAAFKVNGGKPAAASPAPKPEIDAWADPTGHAKNVVNEALSPVQEQIRALVFDNSKDRATRDFGADKIAAAEAAMKEAIEAGQLDPKAVAAQLSVSRHPVGDVVNWHLRQSALTRVGTDPDAFVKAEIEKMLADPTKKAELQQLLQGNGAAPENGQQGKPAPVTELPGRTNVVSMPSLRNVGQSAAPAAAVSEPSDAELFDSVTHRRR